MNINQLLRKLPDELVTDLATKFGLPLTTSTSNQAEMTIIPYLKRNPKEEGDKLLDNIESSLRPYELKRLLSIFRVEVNLIQTSKALETICHLYLIYRTQTRQMILT